jgi:hypothetical protein
VSQILHPASFSPLLLQTQVTLPPAGELGVADPTKLENPFQGPMWLDEIRFTLPNLNGGIFGLSWSSIYCKLHLGGLPLTQGNVPISLFGKALNDDTEFQGVTGGAPWRFTWRLPKPLFIPAREYLKPTFYFAPYSGAAAVTVTVRYACRPLPVGTPTPKTLQVPWVASYVTPFQESGVAAGDRVDESQPSDLYNPWDQDLHVQRFMGRLMMQAEQGEERFRMGLADANMNLQAFGPNSVLNSTGTLVTAQDSFNNILVRDPTPFAHLFDPIDRAWTVNCLLPPKGFYQFSVERFWSGHIGGLTGALGISMVGWREVVYAP